MQLISNLNSLDFLLEKYFTKGTLTNNYILSEAYKRYIDKEDLFQYINEKNAYLLVKKNGFHRLYYFINDTKAPFLMPSDGALVLEIIYRGQRRFPDQEVSFWEKSGFRRHLTRDCYFLNRKNKPEPLFNSKGNTIEN